MMSTVGFCAPPACANIVTGGQGEGGGEKAQTEKEQIEH